MVTKEGCVRVLCSLRCGRSVHLPSVCPTHLLHSLFLNFMVYINVRTVNKGFLSWISSSIELLSMEVGWWKFSFLATWSEAWMTQDYMAGIWNKDGLHPSTFDICLYYTDLVSEVGWLWFAHWVLGIGWCWSRNHNFHVRKKPSLTLPCDLRAHMRLGERWVVKIGHCTQKLLPVISIFRVSGRIG